MIKKSKRKNELQTITAQRDRAWWVTASYFFAIGALLLSLIQYIKIIILEFGTYFDPIYTMEEKIASALHSIGIGETIAVDLTLMLLLMCAALFVSVYLILYHKHYKRMPSKFTLILWVLLLLLAARDDGRHLLCLCF